MKKLRVAIIGCGRISYKHIDALVNNYENLDLVAVCDINIENANKRGIEYIEKLNNCGKNKINFDRITPKTYVDYKHMLEKENIDIVTIATESGYHAEISLYCLGNEKHVIVEKPMAMNTKDCAKMIQLAKENNVKLCVSHQNRFNPAVQKLRKAVEEERFGRIINGTARILWNRDMNYYKQAPWRGTKKLDGGCLMNQCIHDIDLLQWMMGGEIESVYGQTGTFIHDIEGEDFGAIIIRFKNGSIGIVEGTVCVYPKNLEETLSIFGEKGTAVLGGLAVNKIETWIFDDDVDSEEEVLREHGKNPDSVYGDGHAPLYRDMLEAIIEDNEPYVNGEEGIKSVSIIEKVYGAL